ncbi:MAG TPA: peptidoglycan DD-metalloendopeptidase family protein, partial [Phototrophicaceae bacterium]|nr:peptidoglycan DD-metalloendopeptidase family protein [Phototrophicaceae bacterium]
MHRTLVFLSLLMLTTLGIVPENALMQTQCDLAEAVSYPFDTSQFRLAQAFGSPSPRHQGRYHTGEDWFAGRDNTLGTPVHAIAAGRVTYSFPLGWGRDGGVVIIEHTFADGSIIYSMYGHMMETDTIKFPQRLSCIQMGDVVGTMGNARPAPHLHLEIKLNGPDTPGPGYSWANPYDEGWRQPSKFIVNHQAWLTPVHRWHLMMTDPNGLTASPLQLDDFSLMYVDGQTLRLATYDGRVLWRVLLDQPALAVTGYQRQPLVIYANGMMQIVDYEGQMVNQWQIPDVTFASAPIVADDQLLFRTTDDALIAVNENRHEIVWKLEDVPPFTQSYVTPQTIALLTLDHRLMLISRDGKLRDTVQLRAPASFATASDGSLIVYGHGGLWKVDENGKWSLLTENALTEGNSTALLMSGSNEGQFFAFDGASLHAYASAGTESWSLPLVLSGQVTMTDEDGILLLVSTHGQIITAS